MRTIQQLIATHRALIIENEALYDADGEPLGPGTAASDERCIAALFEFMVAPCLNANDVAAKIAHLLDDTLRERGPIYHDLNDGPGIDIDPRLDIVADVEGTDDSLFVTFLRSLSPRPHAAAPLVHGAFAGALAMFAPRTPY